MDKILAAVVLQQGGTSTEWYATSYNHIDDAREAVTNHKNASYTAFAFEVEENLAKSLPLEAEVSLMRLLEKVASGITR